MRKTVLLTVLGFALAGGAACTSTPTGPQSSPTTAAAVTLDSKEVTCRSFTDVMNEGKMKLSEPAMALMEAQNDPAKFAATIKTVSDIMGEVAAKLSKSIETAGDAELKAALTALMNVFNKIKTGAMGATDIEKLGTVMDDPALESAEEKAKTLCA